MKFFDSHMHIDDEAFDKDRSEIIKKIYSAGVEKAIDLGCNIDSSKKVLSIVENIDFLYAAIGLHPEELPQSEEEMWKTLNEIKEMATKNSKVVAIGEIGLDYHWRQDNKGLQKIALKAQIDIANELNLPVSIHTRDAIDDMIEIIRNNKLKKSGVLHCCPFNPELIRHGLENGLYIGFGGTCTYKNSRNAQKILEMVPLDRILIETDSPYLAPEPVRGTRNDSSNLIHIVNKISEFKGISPEKIAKATFKNAEDLFLG